MNGCFAPPGRSDCACAAMPDSVVRAARDPLDSAARDRLERHFGRDFSQVPVHPAGSGEQYNGPGGEPAGGPVALAAGVKGDPPCALDSWKVETRRVFLKPVLFKSHPNDSSPTGKPLADWVTKAATIWGKLAVDVQALDPVTLVNAAAKTKGSTPTERKEVADLHDGAGVDVFIVDNPMADIGGGVSRSAEEKMVLSNQAGSKTLLAHELGHMMGLGHPPDRSEADTIMEAGNSRDAAHPERNTIMNHDFLTWRSGPGKTCIEPDA